MTIPTRTAATLALSLASLFTATAAQKSLAKCSLLGPQYPRPTGIASDPTFQSALKSVARDLDAQLNTSPYNATSFSVGVFSASDPDDSLAWQYHHTTPTLANGTDGTRSVDAKSVYRIGSISKLLTVYLFLMLEGDASWSDPVSKYLPELESSVGDTGHKTPNWTAITLGDLAGQTAGLSRDYGLADYSTRNTPHPGFLSDLLPELPLDQIPVCNYPNINGSIIECSEEEYLQGVAGGAPIFRSASRTVYSNEAFVTLGLVLSKMTGQPFEQLFSSHLVDALGLQGTAYTIPTTNNTPHAVIPTGRLISGWSTELGVFNAAGGNIASTTDLAKVGRAILNSSHLSQAQTSRWLQPSSFVNDIHQGVGRPWEIVRLQVLNRTVDVYTKSGDWYGYSTLFALIPDYDIGFTVLTAVDGDFDGLTVVGQVRSAVPDLLAEPLIEAVDAVAKSQARANFAGTYSDRAANSSITFATDADSALKLTGWMNEGQDLYNHLFGLLYPDFDWRILPNDLYEDDAGRAGFTSFYQIPKQKSTFIGPCFNWAAVDQINFGNVPLGQFVFDVDESGMATGVESLGLRVSLQRDM